MRKLRKYTAALLSAVLLAQSFAIPAVSAETDEIVVPDTFAIQEESDLLLEDVQIQTTEDENPANDLELTDTDILDDPEEVLADNDIFSWDDDSASEISGEVIEDIISEDMPEEELPEEAYLQEEPAEQVWEDFEEESEVEDVPVLGSSLLPVEERKATLILAGYSETELKSVKVSYILDNLRDSKGNYYNISTSSQILWSYYKDPYGAAIGDEYHKVSRSDTVDLSVFADNSAGFKMELLIGSGSQLSTDNVRYIVNVYLTTRIMELNTIELYTEDEKGVRTKVQPSRFRAAASGTELLVPQHEPGQMYYLGITSSADEHPSFNAEVYTPEQYEIRTASTDGWRTATSIAGTILNQNMKMAGTGYYGSFDEEDDQRFFVTIEDPELHTILLCRELRVAVKADGTYINASIYKTVQGEAELAASIMDHVPDWDQCGIKEYTAGTELQILELDPEYDSNGDFYLKMDAHHEVYGEDSAAHVLHVYEGIYDTQEEAVSDGAADVNDAIFSPDQETSQGLKLAYETLFATHGYTIFFDDGTRYRIQVYVDWEAKEKDFTKWENYINQPVIGEQDPWFRVTGVKLDGRTLDAYIVENDDHKNLDTYYGRGYLTVFVNEYLTTDEIRRLVPEFWVADEERIRIRTNTTEDEVSGESVHDFTEPVEYHALFEGRQKNYIVEIVAKSSGAKLYVFGTDGKEAEYDREIFLDEYYEYKHDILIANLGDSQLEGLTARLEDAVHVKIDDFWSVGSSGNTTLAPFTTTNVTSVYGELWNLAKVRLIPDGKGEISGRLIISASGQEDVVINLHGSAMQPLFTTTTLEDAVKYVPYSYVISTSNMYDWLDVTFKLQGNLPPGMSFNAKTGEIYGAPTKAGEYTFTVFAQYSNEEFETSERTFTITVRDNSDEAVFLSSDEGYEIVPEEDGQSGYLGTPVSDYGFVLEDTDSDDMFISGGDFDEFEKLWLNGAELVKGVDYDVEPGSTRITLYGRTLAAKANQSGRNTVSAEFRIRTGGSGGSSPAGNADNGNTSTLRRTSQNFTIRSYIKKTNTSSGTSETEATSPGQNPSGDPNTQPASGTTTQPVNTNTSTPTGNPGSSPSSPVTFPTTIRLNKTSIILGKGKKTKLQATTNRTIAVYWSSSNKKVAVVKNGKITGKKKGTAIISARTSDGKTASCKVTVVIPVKKIRLSDTKLTLFAGKSKKLKVTLTPKTASKKTLVYTSSNPRVARVSSKGKITAVGKGKCTITVKAPSGKKAKCKVTVKKMIAVKGISLDRTSLDLTTGQSAQLTVKFRPAKASDQRITWTSSNAGVAAVANGTVSGVSAGTAVITARSVNGKTASCTVRVQTPTTPAATSKPSAGNTPAATSQPSAENTPSASSQTEPASGEGSGTQTEETESEQSGSTETIPAENISLSTANLEVALGENTVLVPSITPEQTTDKTVYWYSDNPDVADVDGDGRVTALGIGTALIYAETENGIVAVCEVTVDGIEESYPYIDLDKTSVRLEEGSTELLTVALSEELEEEEEISWTSTNEAVATVTDGQVRAVGKGFATIIARAGNDMVATCSVEVTKPRIPATGITLSETSVRLNLAYNDLCTVKVDAALTPENTTDTDVTWTSADETIAIVKNGVIAAVAEGTTTVTAAAAGSLSASVEVTVEKGAKEIRTVNDLKMMVNDLAADYILVNDIDLGGDEWVPIGATSQNSFTGTFDGSGFTIRGLSIKNLNGRYAGLFGVCKGTIQNVTVYGEIDISTAINSLDAGGICANAYQGTIKNCRSYVTITAQNAKADAAYCYTRAGGITGCADRSEVSGCSNYGNVTARCTDGQEVFADAAGIAGWVINGAYISGCYNYADITSYTSSTAVLPYMASRAGGIAADDGSSGTITSCNNSGNIRSNVDSDVVCEEDSLSIAAEIIAYHSSVTLSENVCMGTALAAGSDTVMALQGSEAGIVLARGITLDYSSKTLNQGETCSLTASVTPDDATLKKVIWRSTNNSVVTVEDGLVKAVGPGKATICARARYSTMYYEASCSFTVLPADTSVSDATEVKLSLSDWQTYGVMGIGQTRKVNASVTSETDPEQALYWSSSDTSIITTDQSGNITAVGSGSAVITAMAANGVAGTISIRVAAAYVECNEGGYRMVRGEPFEISFRLYLEEPIQEWGYNYILYTAYYSGTYSEGWIELASFNIDGASLFEERYTGKTTIKNIEIQGNGHIVDVTLEYDTAKLPLMSSTIMTISTFPYGKFSTGNSIYDYMTTLTVTQPG